MKPFEIISESFKTFNLPTLEVGDDVLLGKFKNKKAIIKGFSKDEKGQPEIITNKGTTKLLKPRIPKLSKD